MSGTISLSQVSAALRSAERDADKFLAPVIKDTAEKIAGTQRATVARHSGKTAGSIKVTGPKGQPLGETTVEAEIGPTWFVGRLLEYGTSKTAPQPFVEGSYAPHEAAHVKAVQAAMVRSLGALTS